MGKQFKNKEEFDKWIKENFKQTIEEIIQTMDGFTKIKQTWIISKEQEARLN